MNQEAVEMYPQHDKSPVPNTASPFTLEKNPIWESTAVNTPSEMNR